MKNVPIVFSFDDNLSLAAGVCISSLLTSAKSDTFYDIYILHNEKSNFISDGFLERLNSSFSNFKLNYIDLGNVLEGAFEIRNISVLTYARLLIPKLIPHYDKIMYHDVDIIFRSDLSDIFYNTNLENYYFAGVQVPIILDKEYKQYLETLELDISSYFYAGNLIINAKKIREECLTEKFLQHIYHSNFRFQDMDILNIVCQGKIRRLSPWFCVTISISNLIAENIQQELYSAKELEDAEIKGIIHYNGVKPWVGYCPNFDIWWQYYRNSVFYDKLFYFNFYNSKLDYLDTLSFMKRVKILLRYFFFKKS